MSARHDETCKTLRSIGVGSFNTAYNHASGRYETKATIDKRNQVKTVCLTCTLPDCCYKSIK